MRQIVIVGALSVLAVLNGCASRAPKYVQPAVPVPAMLSASQAGPPRLAEKAPDEVPWREYFTDERLRGVISRALGNNRDLRAAALGIERLQALYQIQRSDLLPRVDASAGASFQRVPEGLSGTGRVKTTDQYTVGLGIASYELDLFGRVASLRDQALEQYLSSEHARRSVQISLVSQVATAWLTLGADRDRLKIATGTLASQRESLQLVSTRYEAGVSSLLDLQQARSSVEAARFEVARLTTLVAQDENSLNQLVGAPVPAALLPETLDDALTSLKEPQPGLSSDILLRRPDILQAEGQLKAANANIGAARAAFFPRIALVSSIGFGSDDLAGLFKEGAFAWSIAPRVSLPIFDGGSTRAGLKVAEIDRDIAVARYEKSIQTAFREVVDVLALQGTITEQLAAQKALTDITGERYQLSRARFEQGVDSHLNVLDSQRSLYAAQQNLVAVRLLRLANLVTFYKVMGGGGDSAGSVAHR